MYYFVVYQIVLGFSFYSDVKDKRKKDLMDPLLIMKDLVDRKKTADHRTKESKKVCFVWITYMYMCLYNICSILKVRNLTSITVKVLRSCDERERREKKQREFELLHY